VHDPAKILLDLAITLALGGDSAADIALLRAQPELFGLVASDPTVSRAIDTLAHTDTLVLTAIRAARAAARAWVWHRAGAPTQNAGSNTAADHLTVLDEALAQIPAHLRQPDADGKVKVLVRTDAAGATHAFTARIAELGMEFSVGAYLHHFGRCRPFRGAGSGTGSGRGRPPSR
jgi:hypothetical protein